MVSLRAVAEAAGLRPVHVPGTAELTEEPGSDPRISPDASGTGTATVSALVGMSGSGETGGAVPKHALLLMDTPTTGEITGESAVDEIVARAARNRTAGIVVRNAPPPELVTACSRRKLPLFCVDVHGADPFAAARALFTGELARARGRNSADHAELLRLITRSETAVEAAVHLVTPGAVVNPTYLLSPTIHRAAATRPPVPVTAVPSEGRLLHIDLGRPGCSLILSREHPAPWSHRRIAAVVRAFEDLRSSVAVSRRARAAVEETFLHELVSGASATVGPWAESLGIPPGSRVTAVVIDSGEADPAGVADAVCDVAWATLRPGVVAVREGRVLALLPKSGPVSADAGAAVVTTAAAVTAICTTVAPTAVTGTSSCVFRTPDDLVHALVSARQVAERERFRADEEEDDAPHLRIPLSAGLITSPDAVEVLENSLLAPLLAQDARHDSAYIDTLRTYLVLNCRKTETADALGVHANTLRYRLARIEALTGRDLQVTADRVDFYLALTLREAGDSRGDRTPHQGSARVAGNSASTV